MNYSSRLCLSIVATLLFIGGCQTGARSEGNETPVTQSQPAEASQTQASTAASMSTSDLRDALVELDKGHHDKMKLAFWVSTPFKSVDPAFKPFYQNMAKQQKELAKELEDWAKAHHVNLTHRFSNEPLSQGQKIMEEDSEKRAKSENKEEFQLDMLINMRQDYGWNASLNKALLPRVTDPALKSYLEKSLKAHEDGLVEIRALLKKYKFEG
ncbi:MAG TPA: hypothetical protein VM008_02775 [Phycisphaerae bacterium]|nr:hypothetical protein [Phycisphaerae bacterium]